MIKIFAYNFTSKSEGWSGKRCKYRSKKLFFPHCLSVSWGSSATDLLLWPKFLQLPSFSIGGGSESKASLDLKFQAHLLHFRFLKKKGTLWFFASKCLFDILHMHWGPGKQVSCEGSAGPQSPCPVRVQSKPIWWHVTIGKSCPKKSWPIIIRHERASVPECNVLEQPLGLSRFWSEWLVFRLGPFCTSLPRINYLLI